MSFSIIPIPLYWNDLSKLNNPKYGIFFLCLVAETYFLMRWGLITDFNPNWLVWDSSWYFSIVQNGYQVPNEMVQSNIVYFPLYPLLIKVFHLLTGWPFAFLGLGVSFFSLYGSSYLIFKIVKDFSNKSTAWIAVVLLLCYPTSFFFHAIYTESLFCFLALLSFYLYSKKYLFWACLFAGLSTATRSTGVFIGFSLMLFYLFEQRHSLLNFSIEGGKCWLRLCLASLLCLSGLLAFMTFQYIEFGNPFLFVERQQAWTRFAPSLVNTFTLYHPFNGFKWGHQEFFGFLSLWSHDVATYNSFLFWFSLVFLIIGFKTPIPKFILLFSFLNLFLAIYFNSGHENSDIAMGSLGRYQLAGVGVFMVLSAWLGDNKRFIFPVFFLFLVMNYFYANEFFNGRWAG